jgi:hypothetical protein
MGVLGAETASTTANLAASTCTPATGGRGVDSRTPRLMGTHDWLVHIWCTSQRHTVHNGDKQ